MSETRQEVVNRLCKAIRVFVPMLEDVGSGDLFRAAYDAGRDSMREEAVELAESDDNPHRSSKLAAAIRKL